MTSPFSGFEVEEADRPKAAGFAFDLDRTLSSVLALEAEVPKDAFTASVLGTERVGNGVVVREDGVVLTIGYLVTEAEQVTLTAGDGRRVPAHVLGVDSASGFGLVHALEPLGLPAVSIGDSRSLTNDSVLLIAGGGGRAHAAQGVLTNREPFAGYWEYLLDDALFTAPAHPHWSGAAVIGPKGDLVGLGSLRVEQQGAKGRASALNMSVPAERLASVFEDLLRGRASGTPRPWLGLFAQALDDKLVVLGVSPGGPAAKAELRRGDIILSLANKPLDDLAAFYRALWALGPAGVEVPLTLAREGDVFDVRVRSADRNALLKKRRLN
ncbi:S1C family serine protease [Caulobacter sp. S45]|uniref:S1C family serine protease n=1 Tax=Caulobacter sp. S45 TaxID=1641861 RepID=UPI001575E089|nr:S1C family serine protease [Caulobacter sp. S45]